MKNEIIKIAKDLEQGTIDEKEARTLLLGLLGVVESAFSFDDLEVWGSSSGATGIVINVPEKGCESVHLRHKTTGKTGYVELNV